MKDKEEPATRSCGFIGTCVYREQCACRGDEDLRCSIQDRVGVVFFVDQDCHPYCKAKMAYGNSTVCLCPSRASSRRSEQTS